MLSTNRRIIGYRKSGAPIYVIAGGRENVHRIAANDAKAAALAIAQKARDEGRDLTDAEATDALGYKAKYDAEDVQAKAIETAQSALTDLSSDEGSFDLPADSGGKSDVPLSFGDHFVKSAGFQEFRRKNPTSVSEGAPIRIESGRMGSAELIFGSKATIGLETGGSPASTFQPKDRIATIDYLPNEDLGLLNLISRGRMTSPMIEYLQITGVTEGAAIVAPGALKPLSDFTTALADARAYTYADGLTVTNQSLADEGFLANYLTNRLPRHLRNVIQQVLLSGTGTGGQPAGILNTSGVLTQAWVDTSVRDLGILDTIAAALEKLENADADVQAIALSVRDYWRIMQLKDAQGRYFSQGPWSQGPGTVWGVPMVKVRRLAAGTALAGDFRTVTLLDREGISVQAFNQHEDYARRNLTYVRAECRAAQAIFEPTHLCKITLTDTTPAA
jgi:HK97 family phage major capsid protein